MPFLSDLMYRPIWDSEGERIGKLGDVLVSNAPSAGPHPPVVAIAIDRGRGSSLLVPWPLVQVMTIAAISLSAKKADIAPYEPTENDLYLVRDVLDQQIIDVTGVRVVRVNDLELARVDSQYYLANVDIGTQGLLRRLGIARPIDQLANRFGWRLPGTIIAWDVVELLPSGPYGMRLKVPRDKLAKLHPADIAEIISDLGRTASGQLIQSLDDQVVADTLEEIEPDFQASVIGLMPDERAADVLEKMAPDEVADLLAELPKERSQELLDLMEDKEAADVERLLKYPDDSAGGIMNTEYVAVQPGLTAAKAIEEVRAHAHEAETIFYVYVTDEGGRLKGVFSLQDLVLAAPNTPIEEFMHHKVVTVGLLTPQNEVAQVIAKYDLLAVPVVDDQYRLQGIVTSDDALDKIIPTAWKKRIPHLYH